MRWKKKIVYVGNVDSYNATKKLHLLLVLICLFSSHQQPAGVCASTSCCWSTSISVSVLPKDCLQEKRTTSSWCQRSEVRLFEVHFKASIDLFSHGNVHLKTITTPTWDCDGFFLFFGRGKRKENWKSCFVLTSTFKVNLSHAVLRTSVGKSGLCLWGCFTVTCHAPPKNPSYTLRPLVVMETSRAVSAQNIVSGLYQS